MKTENCHINPNHYKSGDVQLIDAIRELPYSLGNAVKYIYRAGDKEGQPYTRDLRKAKWYLIDYLTNPVKITTKPKLLINTDEFIGLTSGITFDKKIMMSFISKAISFGDIKILYKLVEHIDERLECYSL